MSNQVKFNLTNKHKSEGFVLTIVWGGGLSSVKTEKGVEKVQKLVQSLHHIAPITIMHWLVTPTGGHWTDKAGWNKKSDREKILAHLNDYVHDKSKEGLLLSWYVG